MCTIEMLIAFVLLLFVRFKTHVQVVGDK